MGYKNFVENYYFDWRKMTEEKKITPSVKTPFSPKVGTTRLLVYQGKTLNVPTVP